jgi:hypothetical protein
MSSTRSERIWRIRSAIAALREARDYLVGAGAPRAAARARRALSSAEGALRHAQALTEAEGGELQTEFPIEDREGVPLANRAEAIIAAGVAVRGALSAGTEEALRRLAGRGEGPGEEGGNGGLRDYVDEVEARRGPAAQDPGISLNA